MSRLQVWVGGVNEGFEPWGFGVQLGSGFELSRLCYVMSCYAELHRLKWESLPVSNRGTSVQPHVRVLPIPKIVFKNVHHFRHLRVHICMPVSHI